MDNDTIVAISTAVANDAISIVRLTGCEAVKTVNKIFKGKNLMKVDSNTINYGKIVDLKGQIIDEVLVSVMRAPTTYTGDDIVEINCHGGAFVTQKVFNLLLDLGVRASEAGEFTKRAFLNGKMDLTQAESVMDLISAKNDQALKVALSGLSGDIKAEILRIMDTIINIIAQIEVGIDYPEYEDIDIDLINNAPKIIVENLDKIDKLLENSFVGKIIKNGINTAIIGKPNVGKSSLLNLMLQKEKAIVTNIAGTTRDIVEGQVNINGIHLNLFDTAGIRETKDIVEQIGIKKSEEILKSAELILLILDSSSELSEEDEKLLELTKDKTRIVIFNKTDLKSKLDKKQIADSIEFSALEKKGLNTLYDKIKNKFNIKEINMDNNVYVTNSRQIALLKEARNSLIESKKAISSGALLDLVVIDLKDAYKSLSEIIGEVNDESLIDALFSKFCLGK